VREVEPSPMAHSTLKSCTAWFIPDIHSGHQRPGWTLCVGEL